MRSLGIPTVTDRIAQTVVKIALEPEVEPQFHPDSYGYRPGKSAVEALGKARLAQSDFKSTRRRRRSSTARTPTGAGREPRRASTFSASPSGRAGHGIGTVSTLQASARRSAGEPRRKSGPRCEGTGGSAAGRTRASSTWRGCSITRSGAGSSTTGASIGRRCTPCFGRLILHSSNGRCASSSGSAALRVERAAGSLGLRSETRSGSLTGTCFRGRQRLGARSRRSREAHVRFWESPGVRFPRATQL